MPGLSAGTPNCESTHDVKLWMRVHGTLMTVAWGLLLPAGVAASMLRGALPEGKWFFLHRGLQCSGLLLSLVAVVLAVYSNTNKALDNPHKILGAAILLAAILQPLGAFLRPHLDKEGGAKSAMRRAWEMQHKTLGRVLLLAGWTNLTFGAYQLKGRGYNATWFFYAIILSVVGFGLLVAKKMCVPRVVTTGGTELLSRGASGSHLQEPSGESVTLLHAKMSEVELQVKEQDGLLKTQDERLKMVEARAVQ